MIDTARHYLDDSTHTTWEQCHRGIPLPGFICAPRTQGVACAS
jgi:hypothetical protein